MNTERERDIEKAQRERECASYSRQRGSKQLAVTQRHNEARQQTAT